eukprot:2437209-Pyramimonas_sp.AAC.1
MSRRGHLSQTRSSSPANWAPASVAPMRRSRRPEHPATIAGMLFARRAVTALSTANCTIV